MTTRAVHLQQRLGANEERVRVEVADRRGVEAPGESELLEHLEPPHGPPIRTGRVGPDGDAASVPGLLGGDLDHDLIVRPLEEKAHERRV